MRRKSVEERALHGYNMVRSKDITYGNIGLLSRHGLCRVGNIFATEDTFRYQCSDW